MEETSKWMSMIITKPSTGIALDSQACILTNTMAAINPLIQAPLMAWFLRWSSKHMPVTPLPIEDRN